MNSNDISSQTTYLFKHLEGTKQKNLICIMYMNHKNIFLLERRKKIILNPQFNPLVEIK